MEIILTHENADFDALASLLAAAKVYPPAIPVLPHRLNRNVREFLSLYRDELPFFSPKDLPRLPVTRVIVVDTQSFVSLKGISPQTHILFIDHHPLSRELDERMSYIGGDTGATTTILVEKLQEMKVAITPLEATLFLLGIYEDTGFLSYAGTTPRDVRCVAWLLERGADLSSAPSFLRYPLSEAQRELYNKLLNGSYPYELHGHSIIISMARAQGYVEEISTLAHLLRDLLEPDALFVLVDMGDRIQMVARSSVDSVDAGLIAARMGGGGHSKAAAAFLQGLTLSQARDMLLEILNSSIKPGITVSRIMSYGVHSLSPETTVNEAAEAMRKYGHEGFPVVEDGKVVGILTRREIDKALQHGLGRNPIKFYMHKGDVSVSPDDPVEKVQKVMLEHGIGQVPVVSEGKVIGIVTRTDLIKLWSGGIATKPASEIARKLEKALPPPLMDILKKAGEKAHQLGFSLYIVGGFVRDLLLGMPTLDLDLVVEGDAIALAKALARDFDGRVRSHTRFGTAKLIIENPQKLALGYPHHLDFTSARIEFYEHPSALPEVEMSSIKQDLYRRDFTINTLAISLNPERFGELYDFYGGLKDLERGLIRVLHNLSFVEDPTRILRAVRLEQRLGFQIESRTLELVDNALDLLDKVSGERIYHELRLTLQESEPEKALRRLEEIKVLKKIHPALDGNGWITEKFRALREEIPIAQEIGYDLSSPSPSRRAHYEPIGALYLALLTYRMRPEDLETLIRRLHPPQDDSSLMRELQAFKEILKGLSEGDLPPSAIYRLLSPYSDRARFLARLLTDSWLARQRLDLYQRNLRFVRPEIDGHYLQEVMKIPPGPVYRKILLALKDARLDGKVSSLEEEIALVEKILAS
ncbi:MAG: CBS domain-containing protein [Anaerolineae bacterium]|nr:CBS domain-containing protein [Anaerolineae bacterium]MDW8101453.1 CBS domain-containing protein [Anaerolineae bacterium]